MSLDNLHSLDIKRYQRSCVFLRFLEYIVFKKDDQGRDVTVIVRLSVDIPECPPLSNELKTTREKITSVTIVRASDTLRSATQVFQLSQCDITKGSLLPLNTAATFYVHSTMSLIQLTRNALREQSRVEDEPLNPASSVRPLRYRVQGLNKAALIALVPSEVHTDAVSVRCVVTCSAPKVLFNEQAFGSRKTSSRITLRAVALLQGLREPIPRGSHANVSHTNYDNAMLPGIASFVVLILIAVRPSDRAPNRLVPPLFPKLLMHHAAVRLQWRKIACLGVRDTTVSPPPFDPRLVQSTALGRYSRQAMQSLSTSHEVDTERADDRIDERCSIYEVIDTKDIVPEKQLRPQSESMSTF
ncbi:hypothetical protein PsorP6_017008 [Peronosclerospora sorghi]|uniref:Uncharacterized protein n=1 Tax=Peronosclerospora sorghi TaxID=230839 RepID=A0ACC0WDW3_9STRA|nr:hypothetical protein PsorP6_017008 [Peronosclerospora sorghi]